MPKWIKIKCKEDYQLKAGRCYRVNSHGYIFEDNLEDG